jgi:hypothetical protein
MGTRWLDRIMVAFEVVIALGVLGFGSLYALAGIAGAALRDPGKTVWENFRDDPQSQKNLGTGLVMGALGLGFLVSRFLRWFIGLGQDRASRHL